MAGVFAGIGACRYMAFLANTSVPKDHRLEWVRKPCLRNGNIGKAEPALWNARAVSFMILRHLSR